MRAPDSPKYQQKKEAKKKQELDHVIHIYAVDDFYSCFEEIYLICLQFICWPTSS